MYGLEMGFLPLGVPSSVLCDLSHHSHSVLCPPSTHPPQKIHTVKVELSYYTQVYSRAEIARYHNSMVSTDPYTFLEEQTMALTFN